MLEREKWVKVGGWKGHTDTYDLVERTHQAYMDQQAQADDTPPSKTPSEPKPNKPKPKH